MLDLRIEFYGLTNYKLKQIVTLILQCTNNLRIEFYGLINYELKQILTLILQCTDNIN